MRCDLDRFFFYFEWIFFIILFIILIFRGFVWTIRYNFFPFTERCRPKQNKNEIPVLCWISIGMEWNELRWNFFVCVCLCMNYTWKKRDAIRMKCIKMYSKNSFCYSFGYSLCHSFVARVQSVFSFGCIIIAPFLGTEKSQKFFFSVCFGC